MNSDRNGVRAEPGDERPTRDDRLRRLREAVRDVPEPDHGPVTREVVKTLREADLGELAKIAERYV